MLSGFTDRQYWVETLVRIARPVLAAGAARRLRLTLPPGGANGSREERRSYAGLEALGRTLLGLAPWLETPLPDGAERRLQQEMAGLARAALDAATDPDSPDFLNFSEGHQPIVDAAFLAHALLRAPNALWGELNPPPQRHLIVALQATRTRKPFFCNWLLFAAMTETVLGKLGADWDRMRVDYALRQHEQWYLGDGLYGDGPAFHWDYYNSFVIQPMLIDIVAAVAAEDPEWAALQPLLLQRAARYAAILERLISPEGTFPPIGRSLVYRFGAFHHLAQMALAKNLPVELAPSQVRCGLTAVIRRMMNAPGLFDEQGWLRIGFYGAQDALGEHYISTGSLYLCTAVFLPLGLPPADPFWADPPRAWTSKRIWSGSDEPCDHAL